MCDINESIKGIVDQVLGPPKRDFSGSNGWYEYNCPCCAEERMGEPDGKYNLAIQIDETGLWGHCWKCGYHGNLSRIIKQYGTEDLLNEYKDEINRLRESSLFTLTPLIASDITNILDTVELSLPYGYTPIKKDKQIGKEAKEYLYNRGLSMEIIEKFNIGFIPENCGRYSQRIIIPSYDMYGDLNYWVARDYTGTNSYKIINAKIDKKSIVFNEAKINWYEPITLVEGPFDHIVVPNSIPLLGKTMDETTKLFQKLKEFHHSTINIFLDDDAISNAYKLYKFLNKYFPEKIRLIKCPKDMDASDIYRENGPMAILNLLKNAQKLSDCDLAFI